MVIARSGIAESASNSDFDNEIELEEILKSGVDSDDSSLEDPREILKSKLGALPANAYYIALNKRGHEMVLYPLNYKTYRVVLLQVFCCFAIFTIFGLNDQSTGSLIPTLIEHYQVSHVQVSSIFLISTFGYFVSALVTEKLHRLMGCRGVFVTGASTLSVFALVLSTKPSPFPLYVLCFFPIGFSNGIIQSVANVLFASLEINKNEMLGILHSVYGCFSFVTPIIINRFNSSNWNNFYYIPCFLALLTSLVSFYAFRFETSEKYKYVCDEIESTPSATGGTDSDNELKFMDLLKQQPICILYAVYLFFYSGTEVGTGSWIFTYLLEVKKGDPQSMSYITASFWAGLTFGRIFFAFMTKKWFLNEYLANKFYGNNTVLFFAMFFLLGLLPFNYTMYFIFIAICVFVAGTFIGPLFPLGSVVALEVLPKKLHVSGVSAAVSLGCSGSALLPWVYGILMQKVGTSVFPFLLVFGSAAFQTAWLLYPKFIKNRDNVFYQQT